jgi:hypothetical protein
MNKDWNLISWCLALEGSIELRQQTHRGTYTPTLKLYNTNESLVYKFKDLVGLGNIYKHSYYDNPKFKQSYIWRLQRIDDVKCVLENIIPYLPIKKEQAILLLEYVNLRLSKKDKWFKWYNNGSSYSDREDEMFWEMKELNRRGNKLEVN